MSKHVTLKEKYELNKSINKAIILKEAINTDLVKEYVAIVNNFKKVAIASDSSVLESVAEELRNKLLSTYKDKQKFMNSISEIKTSIAMIENSILVLPDFVEATVSNINNIKNADSISIYKLIYLGLVQNLKTQNKDVFIKYEQQLSKLVEDSKNANDIIEKTQELIDTSKSAGTGESTGLEQHSIFKKINDEYSILITKLQKAFSEAMTPEKVKTGVMGSLLKTISKIFNTELLNDNVKNELFKEILNGNISNVKKASENIASLLKSFPKETNLENQPQDDKAEAAANKAAKITASETGVNIHTAEAISDAIVGYLSKKEVGGKISGEKGIKDLSIAIAQSLQQSKKQSGSAEVKTTSTPNQ